MQDSMLCTPKTYLSWYYESSCTRNLERRRFIGSGLTVKGRHGMAWNVLTDVLLLEKLGDGSPCVGRPATTRPVPVTRQAATRSPPRGSAEKRALTSSLTLREARGSNAAQPASQRASTRRR